jgi:filamentous hemagglutinin
MKTQFPPGTDANHGQTGKWNRMIARILCLSVLHSAIVTPLQVLAQVVPHASSGKTAVYTAPTGVPVVDINSANAAGVSHNKFDQFNVGSKGLVLNNGGGNQITRNSQLAGQVFTNFNLLNEATLILNEVVSPNRSLLNGYIEVLGGRADVIVANPFGITCSGCGFINTPRATLTTGTPNFGANGGLLGFNVNTGDILINGLGVEARNQAVFDVLARSVKLDGQINGQDVRIISGNNSFDYGSRNVSVLNGTSAAPAFGIDSTLLGGMYANRIRLIATEAGVGVRMLGEVAASGDDFRLDAAGKVQLQNHASAKRDLLVNGSGGIEVSGANASLSATGNIELNSAGGVINLSESVIKSDQNLSLTAQTLQDLSTAPGGVRAARFASGNLNLNITGASNIDGTVWGSGGAFTGQFGTLSIGSGGANLYSGANGSALDKSLSLQTTGDLLLGKANLQSPGLLRLQSGGLMSSNTNALVQAGGNLNLQANGNITLGGQWQSVGNMVLAGAAQPTLLDNQAQLQATGSLTLGGANQNLALNNNGSMLADSVLANLKDVNNKGLLQGKNGVQLTAQGLTNASQGVVLSDGAGKSVNLQVNQLSNQGNVQSAGALSVTAKSSIINSGSILSGGSDGNLGLTAASINNSGLLVSSSGLNAVVSDTLVNSATLQAATDLQLQASQLENKGSAAKIQSGAQMSLAGSGLAVSNQGRIQAGTGLAIGSSNQAAGSLSNQANAVVVADQLTFRGAAVDNSGVLQGNNGLQISSSAAMNNAAGASILSTGAGKDVALTGSSLSNAGLVQSTGALQVNVSGALDNSGNLTTITSSLGGSDGNTVLQAGNINNTGSMMLAGNANLVTSTLSNRGTVQIAGNGALDSLTRFDNLGADSKLVAAGSLALGSQSAGMVVANDGRIQAGTSLTLQHANSVDNHASAVMLGDTLMLQGGTLVNGGIVQGSNGLNLGLSGAITNQKGASLLSVVAGKEVLINAASLDNAGLLQSTGVLKANLSGELSNSGTILTRSVDNGGSDGDVIVRAASLSNASSGSVAAAGKANIQLASGGADNSGTLQSSSDFVLSVKDAINNRGVNSQILSGAALTLTSPSSSFAVNNDGRIQAQTALTIGGNGSRANLTNTSSGKVVADQIRLSGSELDNAGLIQGGSQLLLDLTGGLNNSASGLLLANTSGANLNISANSIVNQGTIQSAGLLQGTVVNNLNNSGTVLTTSSGDGGANGPITLSAAAISNSGNLVSAGSMAVTTSSGSLNNTRLLRAQGDINLNLATSLDNSGAPSLIRSLGNITLSSNNAAITLNNDGSIAANGALTLGSNSHQISSLHNNAGGVLLGNTFSSTGTSVTNAGTVQGNAGVTVVASGALNNSGNVLSTASGGNVNLTLGSVNNTGVLQASNNLSLNSTGAATNSGSILTQDAASNLSLQATSLTNTGVVQAANTASLLASASNIDNSGSIRAVGALDLTVATAFSNTGADSRVLSNSNVTLGTSGSNFSFSNAGGFAAGQALTIGSNAKPAATFTNSTNAVLLGNTVQLQAGSLTNDGIVQGSSGVTVVATGALNNTGTVLSTAAGQDVSLSVTSLTNSGTLQSSGDLSVQSAAAIANSGTIITQDATGSLSLVGSSINNSGLLRAANSANLTANSAAIDNTGTLAAHGTLNASVATAFNNTGTASKLVSDGNISVTGNSGSFAFSNDGGIQSLQTLQLGSNGSALSTLSNSATGTILANVFNGWAGSTTNAGTLQANGSFNLNVSGALNNSGTVLVTNTGAPHDLNLTLGSLTNTGTVQSSGGINVQSNGAVSNSGTVLTQGASDALIISASSINNSGMLDAANSASLTAGSAALDNTGTLQSTGSFSVNVASGFNNTGAGAKLLSGDNLSINSSNATFGLTNGGTVQATGSLNMGANGHLATLNNQSGAKLAGNTLSLFGGSIDNSGRIQALAGSSVNAASFSNHGSTSIFLAATDSSASTMTLSGALSNEGAMHGSGDFTISAAGINNSDTAGLSSLTKLNLNSSGNIFNAGAFYAGEQLNITSSGSVTNSATVSAPQGTFDSGGTINVTANSFTNSSSINATGNITINAATIHNDVAGGDTREWYRFSTGADNRDSTNAYYSFPDNYEIQYWSKTWVDKQRFAGGTPAFKPQIISSGTLNLQGFNSATNVGGVLSAPTINITGNGGGATFTNNDLALQQRDFRQSWEIYTHYVALGPLTYDDHVRRNDNGGVLQNTTTIGSIGAGIFATNLNASGFGLTNAGSPFAANTSATSANASGATAPGSASAANGAGPISAGNGTLANAVGGINGGSASSANGSTASNGATVNRSNGAGAVAIGGVSGSSGVSNVALNNGGKNIGVGNVAATSVVRLPGANGNTISINLPSNPNGFFVTSKDPNSQFLVQANPLFQVGANTVGSNYLAQRLGFDPNQVEKRLGDANYEAYLVRQQLIAQTGSNVIKGYRNEAAQMQALMDQAVTQSAQLGLQFGQEPSPDQLARLNRDIVWMVESEVAGQRVLVPVVYLAKSTRDGIVSGAVIAANDINFDGEALSNVGGSIIADNNLNIKTKGDIKNVSGNIAGGNVNLKSTSGSIVNETVAITNGGKFDAATVIGKTGSIVASKNLSIDAAKDISVKGADIKAAGNASLSAGGNVTFDTIENRTSSSSFTQSGSVGLLGSGSSTRTQTSSMTNIGSNLGVGGNLSIKAGSAVTVAGSNIDTKGNLSVDAKDGINIVSKQDTVDTSTTTRTSGEGVGGGLYGTQKSTTDSFEGKNKASGISVGGNASLKTDGNIVLQGSDLKVDGSASLDAKDVLVLAGKDEKRSHTETETVALFTGANASSKTGTKVDPGSASADAASRTAKAGVSAEATAEANASAKLFSVKKETTDTKDTTFRGSSISVGKNLTIKAKNDVTLEGANVEAKGNIAIDATNINILATEDVHTKNTSSEETALTVSSSNKASAKAGASAEANGVKLSATAQAEARAKASTDNVVGFSNVKTQTTDVSTVHKGTTLKSGGNLDLKAKDQLTFQAANVEAGGNVNLEAKDINTLAAQDTKLSTSNTESTVVGIYIAGEAQAGAKAEASAKVTGVGVSAKADATAEAGTGLHVSHETTKDVSGSSKAVVTSIKAGGNLTRKAENTITDVGAQIAVGGDLTQSAKEINSLAAQNTSFSTSESDKHTVRVGVYGEAGASAGAEAKAGVGGAKAGANAEAHAVGGLKVGYQGENKTENNASLTNTTGSIVVGGNLKSTSSGKTTLEATDVVVRGNTELAASSVDFKAVQDLQSSSSTSRDVDASIKVGAGVAASAGTEGGAKFGPQGEIKAGFQVGLTNEKSNSSTAVTGSLNTGAKLKITTTQGDIRLQGVDVNAGGDVALKSAGNVVLDAAQSTSSSTRDNSSFGASVELKAGGGENSGSGGFNVGVDKGNKSSSTGKAGSIKSGGDLSVDAAKDITLVGTKVAAAGDVGVNAGGKVNLQAIKNTSSDESTNVNLGVGVSASASGGSGNLDLDVALKDKKKLDSDAVSITASGKTKVTAKEVNQEGNVLASNQVDGKLNTTALAKVDKDSDIRFGISVDVEAEKKKKKDADGNPVEEAAKPKDKVNQLLDKLTGFDKPATPASSSTAKKPAEASDPAKKPLEVADASTPGIKPASAKPAKPAKPGDAADDGNSANGKPKAATVDPVKQRQADAEIAHLKRLGQKVDEGSVYKKWGLPLTDSQQAANAAKIPPFNKASPRKQPTEDQSRDAGWKDSAGKWVYPGDDGFKGKPQPATLKVGDTIDRFGGDSGTFFAPVGTPLEQRAMAPGADNAQLTKYKILKPLPVESGEIAPWFDQPGGGTQYKAKLSAKQLVEQGYIEAIEVTPPKPAPASN